MHKCAALVALCLCFAVPLSAAHILNVDCSGATPGAFTSISAAMASVPSVSDRIIQVKGTCAERVQLFDVKNVRLEGNPTATLLHDGSVTDFRILSISRSSQITVRNLTIGAAPNPATPYTPVQISGASAVEIESCTLQGGTALASGGLWISDLSRVGVTGTTIQNNSPSGIRHDSGELRLGGLGPVGTNFIQNNTAGIRVRAGAHIGIWGNNVIQNNISGIIANGGNVFLCCTPGLVIANNTSIGITIQLGGTLQANSPVTFENNGVAGVRLLSGSAILTTGQVFRGNGTTANAGSGALVLTGNSHVELQNADISNNPGNGLLLEESSSARLFNNTIRNNGLNGVRLIATSSARIFAPHNVTGNATDLFCAPNSYARGDDSGFGKTFCPGFDKSPEPHQDH